MKEGCLGMEIEQRVENNGWTMVLKNTYFGQLRGLRGSHTINVLCNRKQMHNNKFYNNAVVSCVIITKSVKTKLTALRIIL